jgi:hypothetical protein
MQLKSQERRSACRRTQIMIAAMPRVAGLIVPKANLRVFY